MLMHEKIYDPYIKQVLKILQNDEKVIFRIKDSISAYIRNNNGTYGRGWDPVKPV